MTGELLPPPMAALMGMELLEVDAGRALFATCQARSLNPSASLHRVAATLIDSAIGCAGPGLPPARLHHTGLQVRYVRRSRATPAVREAVLHRGRTLATARRR